ncbi:troponin C, skeletal muscle [Lingula anatina]|uniref:Troponin C, skeletal muscle n=1 Tax=Lingula anatina TaxID=7574 RepID=A0A1S3JYT8_LINAN|nr:troponin C, skeletal muscle [Lingula anatina]|eukprot:XP_013415553.1 troponin C, skeletal muscle [Lingula anatina]
MTCLAVIALILACATTVHVTTAAPGEDDNSLNPEEIFGLLDTDGDGFISREEFGGALGNHGSETEAEIDAEFDKMDANNDDKISPEEFDPNIH